MRGGERRSRSRQPSAVAGESPVRASQGWAVVVLGFFDWHIIRHRWRGLERHVATSERPS